MAAATLAADTVVSSIGTSKCRYTYAVRSTVATASHDLPSCNSTRTGSPYTCSRSIGGSSWAPAPRAVRGNGREWRGRRLRHQRASRALSRRSVSATLTLADITEAGTQHSAKERGSLAPPVAPEQPPYGRGRLNVRYASAPQSEKGRSATVNDYRSRSDSTVADRPTSDDDPRYQKLPKAVVAPVRLSGAHCASLWSST